MIRFPRPFTSPLAHAAAAVLAAAAAHAQSDFSSPYVPTPPVAVERMLALAQVTRDDVVMDLGSGDGRIVIAAAKRHGARATGVEYDPRLVAVSRRNAGAAGVADRVRFLEGDLFKVDLSPATVVTVYLLPDVNRKLRDKLLAELRPGTRVVAHDFDMESWRPDRVESFYAPEKHNGRGGESRVLLWIVPAEVRGAWRLESAALPAPGEVQLALGQNFQRIEGEATLGGLSATLREPALRGVLIRFSLDLGAGPLAFAGEVRGDEMVGTARGAAGTWPWRATRRR
ncbi:MAG: class I SAM-dependent methyltransferase [Burkholderiales bacterium]|nr:class I SAM-dependent methyltransferase [Burkholderiales bacterium]